MNVKPNSSTALAAMLGEEAVDRVPVRLQARPRAVCLMPKTVSEAKLPMPRMAARRAVRLLARGRRLGRVEHQQRPPRGRRCVP